MDPTLSTFQRIYLQLKRGDAGRVRMVFSRLQPKGGAMVALLSRGSIASDGMFVDLVSDPTQDETLRGPPGKDGINGTNGADGKSGTNGTPGKDGSNGSNGQNGANGADGLSAYQVARSLGYGGTATQWLSTLVGPAGKDGVNGTNGTNGAAGKDGANGANATTALGSILLAEINLISISAGVRRRVLTTSYDLPVGAPLLLLPKAPPPTGYIVQAAWATKTRELTVDLTMPAITALSSYSFDNWLLRLN